MSKENKGLNINAKSFIIAISVILALMIFTYALTFIIPGGEYTRILDENGNEIIDISVPFKSIEGGLPFWKWLLSPVLVLGAEGNTTIIAVIAFLIIIGGVFNSLDKSGLMKYMLDKIVYKYGKSRYTLLAIVPLFFMTMGSMVGSFEECVPMVPIVVALAIELGWDAYTGIAMSLLAVGCGFAAGVVNPFTVGVAQELAGLPMFSGIWLRLVVFVVVYCILYLFIRFHAKKVEKPVSELKYSFIENKQLDKALISFVSILGAGILFILSSTVIKALQDYTMIAVVVMFLVAGVVASYVAGVKTKNFLITFWNGVTSIAPAIIMILFASSIKYTLVEGKILDTILYNAVVIAETMPKWLVILFIYFIVLVMNFFIASGSAKAVLLIPLIIPLAQVFGISSQLCVLAYAFGDGFSNIFYPTNAVLLISLGLVNVGYTDWVKFSYKFQIINFIITSLILLFGLVVGY